MKFALGFSPSGKKQFEKLIRRNRKAQDSVERMFQVLRADPYNLSRTFDIRKLTDEETGKWRIRSGDYRIRYDIEGNRVLIHEVFDRKKGY